MPARRFIMAAFWARAVSCIAMQSLARMVLASRRRPMVAFRKYRNSVIDRATMGKTMIEKGVKLDNLIQIAHNVTVGKNTVVAAQAGIAGSTKIGENCMIGGQVGIVGHIAIANGTKIQAQSGINKAVKQENTALFGSPALLYNDFLRSNAVFKQLPQLLKRLDALEKKFNESEK